MPSLKIVLFTSKMYQNGDHPVMLRVTHNRKLKYYGLNLSCTLQQWDQHKCRFNRNFNNYKEKNRLLHFWEEKAYRIIDGLIKEDVAFHHKIFERKFVTNHRSISVFEFFNELMEELEKKGKAGNRRVYKGAKNALKKFHPNKNLSFSDIDYIFLKKFETHLLENGCTDGGVRVYLRTLRAVINEAIRCGYATQETYPFATQFNKQGYSFSHLKSKAKPRPLSIEDMDKIKNFPLDDYPHLAKSVRYFLFSYYTRGMNFTDMAKLKWSDIYNGRLEYIRSKTSKSFSIKISEPLAEILEHFKGVNITYIFPILTDFHKSPQQVKDRVRKCLKQFNRDLKEVAELLKIDMILTSYVARHTYASTLKKKGVDIAVISEAMGHADMATTKAYLELFSSDIVDAADQVL
ncbi:site-specific integrase [Flavilitoribacter nigricans]|uniref:Integrase n=1 Tax=Flavilitoribacter nigricans (strain ATCC 23147 / DSM 23189 / NBRC 102662 / NCIMB 1420 / SS-2) TaxID=1122177 RepID=A0A2D0NJK9_FLAN2|nr:site-specific integrase [Flavilitoribacter nigricans]PHN08681.1 integrase [Flavilitoribacter nigricans DSM 23189 = NBRC 102662]